MRKHTGKLAWLLLLVTAGSIFTASCGDTSANTPADTQAKNDNAADTETVDTAELTELEKRKLISDGLEDEDFGGKDFRIIIESARTDEMWTSEQDGEACNDALYMRNAKIESRFNVKISVLEQTDIDATVNFFKTMVLGGADDAEIAAYNDYKAYTPVGAGCCMNWFDVPNVDLTRPWHNQLANDGATINGKLFTLCSDLSVSSMTYTYAIFFNTRITTNYDMEPDVLYQTVRDGKWTIDHFIEITKDLYSDLNGDGKKDENDIYGFGYQITNPGDVWLTAFDQPLTVVNADGGLDITFMCEKTDSALTKIRDYQKNSEGFFSYKTQYDEEIFFNNGTMAFAPLRFYAAFKALRDMKDTYSILPFPKWDEAQNAYYTNADDKFLTFSVPQTVSNPAYVGKIFEALSAESYRSVYPTYYDVALKGKYSSDPSTAEMIDLIMSGRKFEVSFQFGEQYFARLPYLFRDLLLSPNVALTKKYASVEKSLNKNLEKFYAQFEDQE